MRGVDTGALREAIASAPELRFRANQASLKGGSSYCHPDPGEPIVELVQLRGRVRVADLTFQLRKVQKRVLELAQRASASREYAEKLVVAFFVAHHLEE